MQSLLLIYADEQVWTESERAHCFAESTDLAIDLHVPRGMNDAGTDTAPLCSGRTAPVCPAEPCGVTPPDVACLANNHSARFVASPEGTPNRQHRHPGIEAVQLNPDL